MGKPKRTSLRTDPESSPTAGKKKKTRPIWQRILMWSGVTILSLAVIGAGVIGYAYATVKLPDPNSDFKTNTSFVLYGDGTTQLGSFQVQNRVSIPYAQMPQSVKDAMVAAENRSFWDDPGISVTGLFRAALGLVGITPADATATGGGSTITQQYIKIMYLNQERTFSRKATELLLAAKMGGQMSKDQILEGYLNTVYFGRGAYGIEAAAQTYFKTPASKLSVDQAAALAAIVNSPGNLDPSEGSKEAADLLERYQYTLNGMVEMGKITAAQKTAVYNRLPVFQPVNNTSRLGGQKGFLLKLVENELKTKGFSEGDITGGGLKIITTVDSGAQDIAVKVAKQKTFEAAGKSAKKAANLHVAIATVDNATGGVYAIYGGPDYVKNSRNWATTARQTGSTFKPYTLAAALRQGWTLNDQVSANNGRTAKGARRAITTGPQISLIQALTKSDNDAFFNLASQLKDGGQSIIQAANDAGAPTGAGWYPEPAGYLPLGNPEISPINQASAYSTFANYGIHRPWHIVREVQNASGQVIYSADTAGSQTMETEVAQDVTAAMTNVVNDGTGHAAGTIGYPAAGKTGTKGQDANGGGRETVAAWFSGFTAQFTTAVMYVNGPDGNQNLGSGWTGSGFPARTWAAYMRQIMQGKERVPFKKATKRHSTQTPTPSPIVTPPPLPPTHSATPSLPPHSASPSVPAGGGGVGGGGVGGGR